MPSIDYKEIFEKAEVGIALNDPDTGTVGRVNERYAMLMGYSRDELQNMAIEEISADDSSFDQDVAMEKIQQALAGERQQFDWLFERKDGSRFWGEVVLKRTTIGSQDRLLAFVRDISDRKQYERELERKNQRLDEFASVVAHDLRNPLRTAKGYLGLLGEESDSERIEVIDHELTRMEELIEDLLTLSREGERVSEIEAVDLGQLAANCWETVATDGATMNTKVERMIYADRSRVQQLLENLIHNAIEHGGGDVTVTVGGLDDGFYVKDTGPGISADNRDEIFDAGYSTAPEGTGFGLSIVQQVSDAHGWDIRVTNGAEGGARFEFSAVEFAE